MVMLIWLRTQCKQPFLRCFLWDRLRGGWRNAILDDFASLGFCSRERRGPPPIRWIRAEMDGECLSLAITADLPPRTAKSEWSINPPAHVREQIHRREALAVSVTTKVLSGLLSPEDLPAAFIDPEALVGWVRLTRPRRLGRIPGLAGRARPGTVADAG